MASSDTGRRNLHNLSKSEGFFSPRTEKDGIAMTTVLIPAVPALASPCPTDTTAPAVPPVVIRRPPIREGTIAVLIPAHNEAEQIADTVRSLQLQTRPPEIILTVSDNSTDATIEVARAAGATVVRTEGNKYKKAGALNAGVRQLLRGAYFPEFIVTIDGDTILERHCIERALHTMCSDPSLGGLSVVCRGKDNLVCWPRWRTISTKLAARRSESSSYNLNPLRMGLLFAWMWLCAACTSGLIWAQRAEYVRAGFVRLRKNVHTLSGAGSVMRSHAIYELLDERRGKLYLEHPGNLVEDFEVTLAIKERWKCTNNCYLIAYTDLMPNLRMLFRQRMRWVGGTINELRRRGWTPETRASIVTLVYGYLGLPLFYVWIYLLANGLSNGAGLHDLWFTGCVATYQAIGLYKLGWRSMLLGFLLVPECLYMLLRHIWLLLSLVCSYFGLLRKW